MLAGRVQSQRPRGGVGEPAILTLEFPFLRRNCFDHNSAVFEPSGPVLPAEVQEERGVAGVGAKAHLALFWAVARLVGPPADLALVQNVELARLLHFGCVLQRRGLLLSEGAGLLFVGVGQHSFVDVEGAHWLFQLDLGKQQAALGRCSGGGFKRTSSHSPVLRLYMQVKQILAGVADAAGLAVVFAAGLVVLGVAAVWRLIAKAAFGGAKAAFGEAKAGIREAGTGCSREAAQLRKALAEYLWVALQIVLKNAFPTHPHQLPSFVVKYLPNIYDKPNFLFLEIKD